MIDDSLTSGPAAAAQRVRLGHAYWSAPAVPSADDVEAVLAIVNGSSPLYPRVPADPAAVERAERVLGVTSPVVYAFAGCLHPKLGTIGLIIAPDCLAGKLQGVSRCDSGGLAGRHGLFINVDEDKVDDALRSVSFHGDSPAWLSDFSDELGRSYREVRAYIAGDLPEYEPWNDVRAECIACNDPADGTPDRRLWTWEIRLFEPPDARHVEALVLSYEAFKQLEYLRQLGQDIPPHLKVIHGSVDPRGVHYFLDDVVFDLFCGDAP